MSSLSHLQHLEVRECPYITALPNLDSSTAIQTLTVADCDALRSLPDINNLPDLQQLTLVNLYTQFQPQLQTILLSRHTALTHLDLDCHWVRVGSGSSSLTSLRVGTHSQNVPNLDQLPALRKLAFHDWWSEDGQLLNLGALTTLQDLEFNECDMAASAGSIFGLAKLKALQRLAISESECLYELFHLTKLTALTELRLAQCPSLQFLPDNVSRLQCLRHIHISSCAQIPEESCICMICHRWREFI